MIRQCRPDDAAAIAAIYAHYVETTTITFETQAPSAAEIENRIRHVTERYPWLVHEDAGAVTGYAYASRFKERDAYRHTAELSVYVDDQRRGAGLGTALYRALIDEVRASSVAVLVGVLALPNEPSIRLHERLGFARAGVLKNVGYKFGRWIDVGYWTLEIRDVAAYRP